MAVVPLCSSGTSAAGADMVREVLSVVALTSRPAAIQGVAVFQVPPVWALQAATFRAVRARLAGPSAEVVLAAVRALMAAAAGLEDKEKT